MQPIAAQLNGTAPRSCCSFHSRSDLVAISSFLAASACFKKCSVTNLMASNLNSAVNIRLGYAFHGCSLQVVKLSSTRPSRNSGTTQHLHFLGHYAFRDKRNPIDLDAILAGIDDL
jgi:hypothetical protein